MIPFLLLTVGGPGEQRGTQRQFLVSGLGPSDSRRGPPDSESPQSDGHVGLQAQGRQEVGRHRDAHPEQGARPLLAYKVPPGRPL